MRPIDADGLIKWANDSVSQYGYTYSTDILNMFELFKRIIGNAPTVTTKQIDNSTYLSIYDEGYLAGLKDKPKRPHGEWKLHGMIWYCSNCGKDCEQGGNDFCGQCGAYMRGKKE